ncbi:membrane protein, putative [Babesia bigemina]|uniref:ATP-dependent RNA helicase n=1 Tax=Babesia bigemina TaxID=5866 RepID=A0A061DCX7_BABBI|nr:membrane protein, putative [Babesia bigemina]CDR95800.1 membrane protein, putative [Babesia bigemina]|eukprot:XP_012767986.1 membrane protein, putative [Babesia bigemina]
MLLYAAFLLGICLDLLVDPRARWVAAVAPGCRPPHLGCSPLHVLGGRGITGTDFNNPKCLQVNKSQCFVGPGCLGRSTAPTAVGAHRKGSSKGVADGGRRQSKKGQLPQKDQLLNAVRNDRSYGNRANGDGVDGFGRHRYPDGHDHGGGSSNYRGQGGRHKSHRNGTEDNIYRKGKYGSTIGSYMSEMDPKVDRRSTEGRGQKEVGIANGRYDTRAANTRNSYGGKGKATGKFAPVRYEAPGPGRWNQAGRKSGSYGEDRWLTKVYADNRGTVSGSEEPYDNGDHFMEPHVYKSAMGKQPHRGARYGNRVPHVGEGRARHDSANARLTGRNYGQQSRAKNTPAGDWRSPVDINAAISKFNRRLAQEHQQLLRASTERLNPLLSHVAHSNQKNQKLHLSADAQHKIAALGKKAKRMTERVESKQTTSPGQAGKKGAENAMKVVRSLPCNKIQQPDSPQPIKSKPHVASKSKRSVAADQDNDSAANNLHHGGDADRSDPPQRFNTLDISANDFNSLPLDVPGIRLMQCNKAPSAAVDSRQTKNGSPRRISLQEKVQHIKEVGFDGIVDINSLFSVSNQIFHRAKSSFNTTGADFSSLGISNAGLIKALAQKGITKATSTQSKYIPAISSFLSNNEGEYEPLRCMSVHAPTGSGKTLAYLLPLFQRVLHFGTTLPAPSPDAVVNVDDVIRSLGSLFAENILVLTPSVELSVQSHLVCKELYKAYEHNSSAGTVINSAAPKKAVTAPISRSPFSAIGAKILGKIAGVKAGHLNLEHAAGSGDKIAGDDTTNAVDGGATEASTGSSGPRFILDAEIRPILLIGNANVANQKRALKELRSKQQALRSEAIAALRALYSSGASATAMDPSEPIRLRRLVGVMFATPGRAHSLMKQHKSLDVQGTKYCVLDEYDGFLHVKRPPGSGSAAPPTEIENPDVKAVIDAILSGRAGKKPAAEGAPVNDRTGKYVLCLSASRLKDPPSCFGKLSTVTTQNMAGDAAHSGLQTLDDGDADDTRADLVDADAQAEATPPRNILHTMALYSVADAKLALLRKLLQAHPYDKSALVFCDSNGTAQFLESYLRRKFLAADVTVLNCRQGKLARKLSFQSVLQSNAAGAVGAAGKRRRGGGTPLRSVVISNQLNSRGIDFSGFSHVIHYDLPHGRSICFTSHDLADVTSYMHRSGRIGRAGNPGISISLVESRHLPVFRRVICNRLGAAVHNVEVFKGHLSPAVPGTMDVFPSGASFFRSASYWKRFYSNPNLKDFDWYGTLDDFLSSFNRSLSSKVPFDNAAGFTHKPAECVVINVGCGNSVLPFKLHELGYRSIYNLDFCAAVLDEMRLKDQALAMHWLEIDVSSDSYTVFGRDISGVYAGHQKVIIDKAFLDAYISVGEGESLSVARDRAKGYINATLSFMDADDVFLIFSLAQDYVVSELMRNLLLKDVYIDVYPLYGAEPTKAHMIQFLFAIYKRAPGGASARKQCMMAEVPHMPMEHFELSQLMKRIRNVKGALFLGSNVQDYKAGRRLTFDIYPKDMNNEVCFTAAVYDCVDCAGASLPSAAIIVPSGQEHFWQYATSEGNEELACQAGARRVIVLWLKFSSNSSKAAVTAKGFVNPFDACFGDDVLMQYIQDNMSDILLKLSLRGTERVTILKAGESCAVRAPRRLASSLYAGDIVVHEIMAHDEPNDRDKREVLTRQMVFSCGPQTVQSEIKYYVDDAGVEHFFDDSAPSEYIAAMLLAMAFLPGGDGVISVLGGGSGTLPRLLRRTCGGRKLHSVEVDDTVVEIARSHFGYKPDAVASISKHRLVPPPSEDVGLLHVSGDAFDYVDAATAGNVDVACFVVDINNVLDEAADGEASVDLLGKSTLMSPHPKFLDAQWLASVADVLAPVNGLLVVNVLTRSPSVLDSVLCRLSDAFAWVGTLHMPSDTNTVAICMTRAPKDATTVFGSYVSSTYAPLTSRSGGSPVG